MALLALDLKIIESRFITLIARGRSLRVMPLNRCEAVRGLPPPYALTDEPVTAFATGRLISVFRRRTGAATPEPPTDPAEAADAKEPIEGEGSRAKKGRPTPKRREAEKHRRRAITAPPRDRKEYLRQQRAKRREQTARYREGMARGDDRYLNKRDQGPVRRLARDYVDARRTLSEFFFMTTFGLMLVSLVLQGPQPLLYAILVTNLWPLILIVFVGDAWLVGYRVKKLARERFPDEELRGLGFYAAMRAMQMRWLRMPKPRLKPGQKDKV